MSLESSTANSDYTALPTYSTSISFGFILLPKQIICHLYMILLIQLLSLLHADVFEALVSLDVEKSGINKISSRVLQSCAN